MKLPTLPLTYCSPKCVGNFNIVGSEIVPKNVIVTSWCKPEMVLYPNAKPLSFIKQQNWYVWKPHTCRKVSSYFHLKIAVGNTASSLLSTVPQRCSQAALSGWENQRRLSSGLTNPALWKTNTFPTPVPLIYSPFTFSVLKHNCVDIWRYSCMHCRHMELSIPVTMATAAWMLPRVLFTWRFHFWTELSCSINYIS